MRLFIAIELEKSIKLKLKKIQDELRPFCIKGNFPRESNFHITLFFAGETDQNGFNSLIEAMNEAARETASFELTLENVGRFRKGNRDIIWVGTKPDKNLGILYNSLQVRLLQNGIINSITHEYRPHITMGREILLNDSFDSVKSSIQVKLPHFTVRSISLMESLRMDGKLTYLPRYVSGFKKE